LAIWIESHVELGEHPKVFVLTETLGVRRAETIGLLHMLWHFTMKFAWRDGDLTRFDDVAIARGSGWEKEPQIFIKALQDSKFLDDKKIHDWQSFAGKLIRDRLYKESTRVLQNDAKDTPKVVTKPSLYQAKPTKTIEPSVQDRSFTKIEAKSFESFWAVYPRKVGKGAAKKAWVRIPAYVSLELILEAIEEHKKMDQWKDQKFIPHPATWINQCRWEDETGKGVDSTHTPEQIKQAEERYQAIVDREKKRVDEEFKRKEALKTNVA